MLKNNLKIIFRNIIKNIIYVLINIIGLGLALAVCIVAYLNYKFDADFDTCHENRKRIFRIEHTRVIDGVEKSFGSTPGLLGPRIADDISGVEKMVRVAMDLMSNVQLLKAGDNETYTRLIYADPEFLDVFTFPLISGSKVSFHNNNNSIFITRHLATVLFGDKDPLGEVILVWDSPYTVGGVLDDHPLNSSFSFQAVVPIQNFFRKNNIAEDSWYNFVSSTFIMVADYKNTEAIEKSLQKYIPAINEVIWNKIERFYLAPFKDMAHKGRTFTDYPFEPCLHPAAVLPPVIAAICILLIACFNYANTTIAFTGKRLKEIGIRKVVGSQKHQLVLQFLGENFLMIFFAFIFAVFFADFLVPSYSAMWDFMNLSFSITKYPELWVFLILLLISTAIISGTYPAFYISSFNPVNIFQNKFKLGGSNIFSKLMLTMQFGITVLALFTGVAFLQNTRYQGNFDMGYDGDYLIEVHGEGLNLDVYKNAIQSYPEIESISEFILAPFFNTRTIKYNEMKLDAKMKFLDMQSFKTMGLRLIEGRSFEPETKKTDEASSILINRKFIEESGINKPVGKTVMMSDTVPLTIIGVIENLLDDGTMTTEIAPIFYRLADDSSKASSLYIRVAPENRQKVFQYLKNEWNKLVPDRPFLGIEGDIYSEASLYINKKILTISIFLVLIATLLSTAGLYSQVSLRIIHRTKEIAVRKIFGASMPGIIKTLNYEIFAILGFGSIVGVTVGYYLNIALMDTIWEYFTDLTAVTFIVPIIIIFVVSVITVSGKVYYAATRNPADSLRYE
jgi:putative ABC transport system permease protein